MHSNYVCIKQVKSKSYLKAYCSQVQDKALWTKLEKVKGLITNKFDKFEQNRKMVTIIKNLRN